MHLAELEISGFRTLHSLTFRFRPGLNVIVGPNNIGKTAVVDALRALLATSEEGSLRADRADLHVSAKGKAAEIRFHYVFRQLTADEEADFLHALKPLPVERGKPVQYEAHLWVRYTSTGSGGKLRYKRWCGDHEESSISSEMLEDLRAIYLPPLRDPDSGLRPGRGSQLARLIDRLSNDAEKEALVDLLKGYEETLKTKPAVANTQAAIEKRHEGMLGAKLKQMLQVGLTAPEFQRIAARLSLAVDSLDVEQNGLGYNNLIYMAIVLSELAHTDEAAYTALIIEEPEAHLHPQLQAVLLDHLEGIEQPVAGEKAVQVFVTSHSPNFASLANVDSLACLHRKDEKIGVFFPRDAKFDAKKNHKAKLQRYLDVTRADLFFARRIILVEGAAERFMVNALALKSNINLRHHAVSILSAEGLNFDCFAPLFGDDAIPVPVAILSDSDCKEFPQLADALSLSLAADVIQKLNNSCIRTFFAMKTFEYDLALHQENHEVMLKSLAELHPDIAAALGEAVAGAQVAEKAAKLFCGMFAREKGTDVKKGAFAQVLAAHIADPAVKFKVPPYILDAFAYVTKS